MKFTIKTEILKKIVKRVASFPDQNLLVRIGKSSEVGITFETYSRQISAFIETWVAESDCESVNGDGIAVFPFKHFRTCVELLNLEFADVEVGKDFVVISCGNSRTTIRNVEQTEFHYGSRIVPECTINAQAAVFAKNVAEAGKWTSTENASFAIGGVLLSKNKGGIVAVATDGRVMCALPIKCEVEGELPDAVIIPAFAANMLSALCRDVLEEATIHINADGVAISWESVYFRFNRLEGRFPNWKRVAPKEDVGAIVEFNREQLEAVVNSVCKLNDEKFKKTLIEFRPYETTFSFTNERSAFCDSITTSNGDLSDSVRIDGSNLRWISTCPAVGDLVQLQFVNDKTPLVVRIDETLFVIAPCVDEKKGN